MNLFLPTVFEVLCRFEEWATPLFVIQISVLRFVSTTCSVNVSSYRSIVIRLVGLYVFFYTQYIRRLNYMVCML